MPSGYTPIYRIEKSGIDITARFNDRATQIKIDLQAGDGNADMMIITLDDRDWAIAQPFSGETLGVWLGYEEIGLAFMGTFTVSDIIFQGMPRAIQMVGTAQAMNDMQKAPQIKEFANETIGGILGSMGLPTAIGGELAGITIPFKNQITSNMSLVNELEQRYGAVAKVVNGQLMFVKRDGRTTAGGVEMATTILNPGHFGTWKVKHSIRPTAGSVQASWWDSKDQVRRWVDHAAGGDSQGGAFGGAQTLGGVFNDASEAMAAAKSKMESLKRAEVTATFDLAKGDPWFRDQMAILVANMRPGVDGGYLISKATHTYIKSTGIKTTLECKASGMGDDLEEASKEFWEPIGNETLGEMLARTPPEGIPANIIDILPM